MRNKRLFGWFSIIVLMLASTQIKLGRDWRWWFENLDNKFSTDAIAQLVGPMWQYSMTRECVKDFAPAAVKRFAWYFCYAADTGKPSVVLLGNSHANSLVPGLMRASQGRFGLLSIGACDITGTILFNSKSHPCNSLNFKIGSEAVEQVLGRLSVVAIIIDGLQPEPSAEYLRSLSERIQLYARYTSRIVIVEPHFKPGIHPKDCFDRPFLKATSNCASLIFDRNPTLNSYVRWSESLVINAKVDIFKINDFICQERGCRIIEKGIPLFRDSEHISERLSLIVGGPLLELSMSASF